MREKIDITVAYSSLVLLLLSPFYYVLYLLSLFVRLAPNSVTLLILAMLIDILLVRRVFKVHYN
ncbi:hypothetical protein [Lactobacillus parabuchneri] [Lactiplantibacillus mudanjiangensis]|nr:hypothetical protein [Lactobacillus parabuchneri] [Lactiplantibacillus mudanjiangensis]